MHFIICRILAHLRTVFVSMLSSSSNNARPKNRPIDLLLGKGSENNLRMDPTARIPPGDGSRKPVPKGLLLMACTSREYRHSHLASFKMQLQSPVPRNHDMSNLPNQNLRLLNTTPPVAFVRHNRRMTSSLSSKLLRYLVEAIHRRMLMVTSSGGHTRVVPESSLKLGSMIMLMRKGQLPMFLVLTALTKIDGCS